MSPELAGVLLALAAGAAAGAMLVRFWPRDSELGPPAPEQVTPDPIRQLGEMLDLLPGPMLLLGRGLGLRHANPAAREPFGDVLAALLRHPLLADAAARLGSEEIVTTTIKLDVPVRRVLLVSLKALPGNFAGLLVLAIADHTHQAALERMREDFVANASHELRTPLASLIGFIDTLLGPAADDPPAQQRFLAIMQAQAARMRRLIENLTSLSRIQLLEHEQPRGRVSLSQVAASVAGEFEPLVRARKVSLILDIAPDLPPVQGDADQVAQIVQNLLDNALKYAGSRIELSARPASGAPWPSAPGLVLGIADDGPGIAAHHLPRLTERFYRAESSKAGSGLGLAIVKHIVGRHSGRLRIESVEGKGCLASVWLPSAPVIKPP